MRSAGLPIEVLIEYMVLFQQGDETIEARKELLITQRRQLQARFKEMTKTLECLDYKIFLMNHAEAEFVQLQINYADWENDNVQSRLCYETARKHNKPVIVMEPVKGGALAAMSPEVQSILKAVNPDLSVPSWAVRCERSESMEISRISTPSNFMEPPVIS